MDKNALIKTSVAERVKNKTQMCITDKKHTSDQKTT